MTIRKFCWNDAEFILRLIREEDTFPESEVQFIVKSMFDDTIYVALEDKRLIGFVGFARHLDSWSFDIKWLCVEEKSKKKGIATKLMKRVEREIKKLDGKNIILETGTYKDYLPARRLYKKLGFTIVSQIPEFYCKGSGMITYLKQL